MRPRTRWIACGVLAAGAVLCWVLIRTTAPPPPVPGPAASGAGAVKPAEGHPRRPGVEPEPTGASTTASKPIAGAGGAAAGETSSAARPAGTTKVNPKDGLTYVWIPPGTFQMGCPAGDTECDGDEKPAHEVTITQGFWMGRTSVTVGAWKRYRAATGTPALPTEDELGRKNLNEAGGDDNLPVVFVNWEESRGFCEWSEGRLPTEAEWEYAARAGATGARYGSLDAIAWYADNSGKQRIDSAEISRTDHANLDTRLFENGNGPHPVGQKQPNAWNLYDMLGNVGQWTADQYDAKYYDRGDNRDPLGPPAGQERVLRGGSWVSHREFERASFRGKAGPEYRNNYLGVRCAGNWQAAVVPPPAPGPIASGARPAVRPANGGQPSKQVAGTGAAPEPVLPPSAVKVNPKDGLKYVWIPPGTFQMGCPVGDTPCDGDAQPAHEVTITKGYWMGQTSVTVGAWKRYRAATGQPALPTDDEFGRKNLNEASGDDNMPVVSVNWEEARGFCEWSEGRLPTEAEWEYAARAGATGARYGSLDAIGWYADNSGKQRIDSVAIWRTDRAHYESRLFENGDGPHPVGQKQPNAWNLYDMLGNVWQWTADRYDEDYYDRRDNRDPLGPSMGKERVLRGGSWDNSPGIALASERLPYVPEQRSHSMGVRCAGNWQAAVVPQTASGTARGPISSGTRAAVRPANGGPRSNQVAGTGAAPEPVLHPSASRPYMSRRKSPMPSCRRMSRAILPLTTSTALYWRIPNARSRLPRNRPESFSGRSTHRLSCGAPCRACCGA
ncbi:MAG: formylglycine-generating enzyme family protein [Terriglobia bacterium]